MDITVLNPTWNKGDNQFLDVSHIQIQDSGKNIGEIIVTRFDWSRAESSNTHKKWIARDDNILGENEMYIFNKNIPSVSLTPSIGEFLSTNDPIIFLNHFKVSPNYCSLTIFVSAMEKLIDCFYGNTTVLFIPHWKKLQKSLVLDNDDAITLFHTYGLIALDDHMLFRYMDNPLDEESSIDEDDEILKAITDTYEIE